MFTNLANELGHHIAGTYNMEPTSRKNPRHPKSSQSPLPACHLDIGLVMLENDESQFWLVVLTILKNMKVSWAYYSQYMEKIKNVPNHQPAITLPILDTVSKYPLVTLPIATNLEGCEIKHP